MTARVAARRVEQADRRATHRLDRERDTLPIRTAGLLSEVGDQPQMRMFCAATIAAGVFRRDPRLVRASLRMLAAHTLATWAKSAVKAVVDRTRPDNEQDGYRFERGDSDAHGENSFPSGHSAGAVAVARAFAREYPEHAAPAIDAAGAVALVQVPRGKHFIGDVAAGSLIGVIAEVVVGAVWKAPVEARTRGHAPFTVPPSTAATTRTPPKT